MSSALPVDSTENGGDYGTTRENEIALAGHEGDDGGNNTAEKLAITAKVNDVDNETGPAAVGTDDDDDTMDDTGRRVSPTSGKPLLTLDEMSERLGFGCFHVELLFVVSAIWMADAMEMMLISFVSPPLQCYFDLTDAEKAAITSVVFIGMFFGSTSWGYFQDHVGRKIGYYVSVAWVRAWVCHVSPVHILRHTPVFASQAVCRCRQSFQKKEKRKKKKRKERHAPPPHPPIRAPATIGALTPTHRSHFFSSCGVLLFVDARCWCLDLGQRLLTTTTWCCSYASWLASVLPVRTSP